MHEKYMKIALELAKKGSGYTNPNPLVGAVIVKNNKIIARGYHACYGKDHAEINAFKNAIENVKGATMYVTLEPCSHYGKTPPCAKAIVKKGIKKVVIAMKDPNPVVSGKGIEILQKNDIEVITGVMEEETIIMNEIFIKYITTKQPYCILKTAMTLDGKIATKTGDSKWITDEISREYVHQLRHRVSGIMVGIGTVLKDNPQLTTRLKEKKGTNPVRIIIDTNAKIPLNSNVMNINDSAKTIIATTKKANKNKLEQIKEKGAKIIITPLKDGQIDLKYLIIELGKMNIDSILIEGGSTLNYSALKEGIIDKVLTFIAPKIIGGQQAYTPVGGEGIKLLKNCIQLDKLNVTQLKEDILLEGYIKKK